MPTLEMEQVTAEAPKARPVTPAAEPATAPTPKRKLRWLLLLIPIVGLLVGGYLYLAGRGKETTDDAQVDGHVAPVAARIQGTIVEVLVDYDQPVKAGQVIARIDPRDYQVRVDQAKAAVLLAENQARGAGATVPLTAATTGSATSGAAAQASAAAADYERSQAVYEQASTSAISYALANVESKRAANERAQADLARMKPLVEHEEISRLQYDAYVAAARVAAGDLRAAEEQVATARQNAATQKAAVLAAQARVQGAQANVEQARAQQQQVAVQAAQAGSANAAVAQARANLEAAELNLSYATIVAPVDGVVTRKTVEVGQIVQPGQTLLNVVPLNDIWVTANFKETQLRHVQPGQRAEVKLDLNGQHYDAHVESIASSTGSRLSLLPPENATGNYVKVVGRIPVRLRIENLPRDQKIFRPGMNVEATILVQ